MRRLAGVTLVAGLLLAGCASPRNSLGAGSTACFKAIPPALKQVNSKGTLQGVREVDAARLAQRRPELARLGKEHLCLVAFRADYRPGDVPGAAPPGPGRYAVIAVDSRTGEVVASFVTETLPIRFRHQL